MQRNGVVGALAHDHSHGKEFLDDLLVKNCVLGPFLTHKTEEEVVETTSSMFEVLVWIEIMRSFTTSIQGRLPIMHTPKRLAPKKYWAYSEMLAFHSTSAAALPPTGDRYTQ